MAHSLTAFGQERPGWQHSGAITILTTPEGAGLPSEALIEEFPLLVRLHKDFFDFRQTKPLGEDIRFSSSDGEALHYQIEHWDVGSGTASIWVRIPKIEGNSRRQIRIHWGKPDAASESNGAAVFSESNGYVSVWHLGDEVTDEVGTLESKDVGTETIAGMIGKARHFPGRAGVFGGDKISDYPTGNTTHSTQAWFRAEQPNSTIIGWGNEQAQGKVVMQFRSPPHVRMDCYFSDGNVAGKSRVPMNQWAHVVYTYRKGDSRVYVNGVLDGVRNSRATPLSIRSPSRLWLGGWYNNFTFVGDMDEVRVSNVVRSADWIRLEYENQKPMQNLVGHVVQPGDAFSVSKTKLTVLEGESAAVTAQADGAQKVFWMVIRDGHETIVATDRFGFTFTAGRVSGDETATLRFKAIYPDTVKARDIPITIKEAIAEPAFTLRAPTEWDGRTPVEVVSQVSAGGGELNYDWEVSPIAVIKEEVPGRLILKRAQNSGLMTVSATLSNGGKPTTQSVTILVQEPQQDAWVARTPDPDEQPEDGQFFARDVRNEGTLFYTGTLTEAADTVYLKLYSDDNLVQTKSGTPAADGTYALSVKLKPGLIKYRVEFGTKDGRREKLLHTAKDLVCGDAFIINGQSNAVATDWGKAEPTYHSEWLRSFGSASGSPQGVRVRGEATQRARGGTLQIGYWGMELGQRLVENQKMPIFLINGAVGGTRIDQHQRNHENAEDMTTIYGRLLWRVRQAKLTHGIRGVIWHQGENDQGADGPTGGFGYETYRQYFIDLAAAWKQDFPNIQHYYAFQIWPKSCAMGTNGSDNRLREVQRTLPTAFSNLSIMSTLGIDPPGGCHYPAAGYAEFARLIYPLIERDHYGKTTTTSITPPNLKRAYYSRGKQDEIVLEFDQPVKWSDALASQFYLDAEEGKVASGRMSGNVVTLKLAEDSTAKRLSYLDSKRWSQKNLLRGENGIAALTFCEVPIE